MEDATSFHPDQMDSSLITTMEFDLLDELLLGGDWSCAPPPSSDYSSGFYLSGTSPSVTAVESLSYLSNLPGVEESTSSRQVDAHSLDDDDDDDQATPGLFPSPPTPKQLHHSRFRNQPASVSAQPRQDESPRAPSTALVSASPSQIPSVKDRLTRAIAYIKECYDEGEILIQIWVPIKRGDKQVLTTSDQPFSLDPTSQRLGCYRTVSVNYLFSAEVDSKDDLGLPGRVFLGRLPEWTPDVRLFRRFEYPRVGYAQHYDVRGSIGIPVFDRGGRSNSCLGVVEVVMTTQKVNYGQEIANMCSALQAVDLCGGGLPRFDRTLRDKYDSYIRALPEIAEVLKAICELHNLPLGQAWMHCIHQGKKGSRHTSDNYGNCVSTVDNSCFVNDPSVMGFHEASSEHHLFKGQGVAGKAFTTNKPCFSPDITAFQKTEYPLSHHAKVFNLRGAVAIRLRSIFAAKVDFVLELFLPSDCIDHKEQNYILNSMSMTIQQVSRNLRAVTAEEVQDDCTLLTNDYTGSDNKNIMRDFKFSAEKETCIGVPLSQCSGTSLNSFNESSTSEGKILQGSRYESQWNTGGIFLTKNRSSNLCFHKKELDSCNNNRDYNTDELLAREGKERKSSKPEKMISLKVLQKYFAGSLKDAAKDLGVCPTTLKRICRQHGITRWPSRKIKKVGHSLKKLQKVIDSVQGIDKAFQLSSLCASIEKPFGMDFAAQNASEPTNLITLKVEDSSDPQRCLFDLHTSLSNSTSSSCSQNSTQSHICSSTEKLHSDTSQGPVKEETNEYGTYNSTTKSGTEEVDLNLLTQQPSVLLSGSHSLRSVSVYPLAGSWMGMNTHLKNLLGVKASYGEDKVRFRFQPKWSLQDLRQEIAMRFSITNPDMVELKYLDDDSECVLLTCDADLQECIEVHQSANTPVMNFFVNHSGQAGGS